jgi:hypothetical protein
MIKIKTYYISTEWLLECVNGELQTRYNFQSLGQVVGKDYLEDHLYISSLFYVNVAKKIDVIILRPELGTIFT